MSVSQKCQYALRAILELARRDGNGPTSIREIADARAIPQKFLESILSELRRGGFVQSRRGVRGGYVLAVSPRSLCAGEIIRFVDGPVSPVRCMSHCGSSDCPHPRDCAFMEMWTRARDAVAAVYDTTTFQDLIEAQLAAAARSAADYNI